ncbi:hypothetical protein DVK85_12685 [Flavobacterium arcticum]|uniref:Uncharacterized protein n=1 Tax=Flavobacterium arcticum TaxID=1784713 RepID=A0A345HEM7_9FLAO|nr:hypothetical protein [Flavobacterium arcticum]AXG75037.1 hypothetical protein DVK85_12685 [Flavobacterium arcticum]KAF2511180.1 hypothetical protein E0W72_07255 [Flavobacterium arcticum]
MKYLLLFFCISFFHPVHSQPSDDEKMKESFRKGITEYEFQIAKQRYLDMIGDETYIQYKNNINMLSQKLNGVKVFPEGEKVKEIMAQHNTDVALEEYIKKSLKENLNKTDFSSVDEALELYRAGKVLLESNREKHKELYDLLWRSSQRQWRELREIEYDNVNKILINSPRH